MIKIELETEKLISNLKFKGNRFEYKKQSIFLKYLLLLENEIKEVTPKRTSTLVRSIHPKSYKDGFRLFTNLSYATMVENGTKKFKGRKYFETPWKKHKPKIIKSIFDEIQKAL